MTGLANKWLWLLYGAPAALTVALGVGLASSGIVRPGTAMLIGLAGGVAEFLTLQTILRQTGKIL